MALREVVETTEREIQRRKKLLEVRIRQDGEDENAVYRIMAHWQIIDERNKSRLEETEAPLTQEQVLEMLPRLDEAFDLIASFPPD